MPRRLVLACGILTASSDGRGYPLYLASDLLGVEATASQALNLVAFVLAQMRVAHALLYLAVERRRRGSLRRSTAAMVYFKVEFAGHGWQGRLQVAMSWPCSGVLSPWPLRSINLPAHRESSPPVVASVVRASG